MKGLVYRFVGPPPDKEARRSERLRWIRRLNSRCGAPAVAVGAVLLLLAIPWYSAVACIAVEAYTLASISLTIRRAKRKESAQTDS